MQPVDARARIAAARAPPRMACRRRGGGATPRRGSLPGGWARLRATCMLPGEARPSVCVADGPWRGVTQEGGARARDELLARLATLVPPPRVHGVRYPGVLAPNAKARARVVPQPRESPSFAATSADDSSSSSTPGKATGKRPYRVPWADLLRRVLAVDVLSCPCGGRLQLVAFIAEVTVAKRILDHLGLDSPGAAGRPRPGAARRARPRLELRRRRLRLPGLGRPRRSGPTSSRRRPPAP